MGDSTHWTRAVAYELTSKVAEEDIKRLIVEMELATSDLEQAYLPDALVAKLSSYDEENLEPFLLAWQLVLHLVDAAVSLVGLKSQDRADACLQSASVRSALVDQLRQEDVVSKVLLPALIQRLGITNRVGVPAIQVWDVSSFELHGKSTYSKAHAELTEHMPLSYGLFKRKGDTPRRSHLLSRLRVTAIFSQDMAGRDKGQTTFERLCCLRLSSVLTNPH